MYISSICLRNKLIMLNIIYRFIKKNFFVTLPIILILTNFFSFDYYYLLALMTGGIIITKSQRRLFDLNLMFLLLFLCLFAIIRSNNNNLQIGFNDILLTVFLSGALYVIGKYLGLKVKSGYEFLGILLFFTFSFTFIPFLSNVLDILEKGFMSGAGVELIWSDLEKGKTYSSTNFASYFSIAVALAPSLIIKSKNSKENELIIIMRILFFVGLFSASNLTSRTSFFLIALSLLAYIIFMKSKDYVRFSLLLVFFTIVSILFLELFDLRSWLKNTPLFYKFFIQDSQTGILNTRTKIWEEAFDLFLSNPFGNTFLSSYQYAHNLWLDVAIRTGVLTFIVLLIFTLKAFITKVRLLFVYKDKQIIVIGLSSIVIGFYGTFMVEPIMEGYSQLFNYFCFTLGFIYGGSLILDVEKLS